MFALFFMENTHSERFIFTGVIDYFKYKQYHWHLPFGDQIRFLPVTVLKFCIIWNNLVKIGLRNLDDVLFRFIAKTFSPAFLRKYFIFSLNSDCQPKFEHFIYTWKPLLLFKSQNQILIGVMNIQSNTYWHLDIETSSKSTNRFRWIVFFLFFGCQPDGCGSFKIYFSTLLNFEFELNNINKCAL